MNSAAAIRPPSERVYCRSWRACSGCQTPLRSRAPGLVENEVTICAFTARAKSMTPFHCARVSTPLKPCGALGGGGESASWKYTLFAHVPLTRMYAGPRAAASFRSRAFERSIGGRYWYGSLALPALAPYGFQKRPPMTSTISTLYERNRTSTVPMGGMVAGSSLASCAATPDGDAMPATPRKRTKRHTKRCGMGLSDRQRQRAACVSADAELLHVALVVPEEVLLVHHPFLGPVPDGAHRQLERFPRGRNGLAVRRGHRASKRAFHQADDAGPFAVRDLHRMLLDARVRCVHEHRLHVIDMPFQPARLMAIGPVHKDIVGVALVEPHPVLVGEDVVVQVIECRQMLLRQMFGLLVLAKLGVGG